MVDSLPPTRACAPSQKDKAHQEANPLVVVQMRAAYSTHGDRRVTAKCRPSLRRRFVWHRIYGKRPTSSGGRWMRPTSRHTSFHCSSSSGYRMHIMRNTRASRRTTDSRSPAAVTGMMFAPLPPRSGRLCRRRCAAQADVPGQSLDGIARLLL